MAIVTDQYVAYDTAGRYYYLTEAGLVKYTGREELIALWSPCDKRLKIQGRLLHNLYTNSAYNQNVERYRHKDIIEYRIFKDGYGERDSIIEALTYFIEITFDSDLDRLILQGAAQFPESITKILVDSGVLYTGHIPSYVPEDEYEVGY